MLKHFNFRKRDVKIYFHKRGQFLDLSGRMGFKFYKGMRSEQQVSFLENIQISRTLGSGKTSCSNGVYDQCIYNMLEREMKKDTMDKCTVPWVPCNSKVCSNAADVNTSFEIAWNRVTNQKVNNDWLLFIWHFDNDLCFRGIVHCLVTQLVSLWVAGTQRCTSKMILERFCFFSLHWSRRQQNIFSTQCSAYWQKLEDTWGSC